MAEFIVGLYEVRQVLHRLGRQPDVAPGLVVPKNFGIVIGREVFSDNLYLFAPAMHVAEGPLGGQHLRKAIVMAGIAVGNDIVVEGYATNDFTGVSVAGFDLHNHLVAQAMLELVTPASV